MSQDIKEQLREYADDNGYSHNDYADSMREAADHIEALERQLAELRKAERRAPEWQPIETAPKDGTRIMLGRAENDDQPGISTVGWWQEAIEDGIDYMGGDAGFVDCDFQAFCPGRSFGVPSQRYAATQPTHWMPLPASPTAGGQGGEG